MKVGVIGAGMGGLAIAIRLVARGYDVTVYEKNERPGGKISELKLGHYRFDTGPSLFTLPDLAEELFDICGENIHDWLPFNRLETNCKYFFADGTIFNFYHDKELLADEVRRKTKDSVQQINKRLNNSEEVYEMSAPVFLFNSFADKLSDFNTPPYKKIATRLYKLDFFRTMNQANKSDFKDGNLVQLFNRYATYNGSNPYKAPATLNMIAHLENNIGAFFPKDGMYSIIDNLHKLAEKKGVKFHFNTLVDQIRVKDKKAVGLVVNGFPLDFDIIISDADVRYVANNLLENHPLKARLNKGQQSSSALIFYWGINRKFNELELHNILFSGDYKTEFTKIFNEKTIYHDPTVYLFISSKIVDGDAPDGCQNWFVMINVPANSGQDWDALIAEARSNIIRKINAALNIDITQYIVEEEVGSPLSIEAKTMSSNGALYGMASNSMFSAFLRHPNRLSKIKDLYFVGGSVHPGGGIPLCMASAKIVNDQISEKYERESV